MKTKGKLFISFIVVVFLSFNANAQLQESKGEAKISYIHKKEMSVEDFFQKRMKQSKMYKVTGKKLEIFFEKDNTFFLGRNLLSGSDGKMVKVDTLYTIPKESLVTHFPAYHLEGDDVRDVIYKYLYKNIPGFSGTVNSKFTYKLDKNIIDVDYKNISRRYIIKKSTGYHFKISTDDLKILDFKKY
ncbi:hypothetical protein [Chryseobacterium taeanense]|uniref:hypothetical protein n=1 Tax=Chryseobacterium taeanense TaxID=311334 RepID=UPI0035AE03F9